MSNFDLQRNFRLRDVYNEKIEGNWKVVKSSFSNFGYFGGGLIAPTTRGSVIDRIDYSNDTATASVRGPLSLDRENLAATGNSSFGYFGGGGPGRTSIVDRIDYSNDNIIALRGPLSDVRTNLAATGNSSFGYFGGGIDGSPGGGVPISTVERIDYSNDTATASVRSSLSLARINLAATGNNNFGYFCGGLGGPAPSPTRRSIVDRIDYSNDTHFLTKGLLSNIRERLAATGNKNFGYFGGGLTGPAGTPALTSAIDRIDYSNDTATAPARGPLSSNRDRLAATGNKDFGYFGGGFPGPTRTSIVDRIDYSNDTATASVRGLLNNSVGNLAALTSSSFLNSL